MKAKLCALTVVALVIWGLKRHYSDASADDLWWILSPTARLAGIMTSTAFAASPGEGYVSHERLFLIEKSCAGINFMIAAFGMSAFALMHRVGSGNSGAWVVGLSLLAGYVAAVLVNAARIAMAMWLAAHPVWLSMFTAAQVHRLEGIAVYFGGLVLLHELVLWLDCRLSVARVGR